MNVRKLEALVTAVDLGSFSRAAERLGYTQSGLTHMMNSLEEELGFPVIRRGSFGIRPTEEGERLLPGFRRLVAAEQELLREVRRIREGEGAPLRVGALPSLSALWLPRLARLLLDAIPTVRLRITEGESEALYDGLAAGQLDLVLAERREGTPCRFVPLLSERLLAVLPQGGEGGAPLSLRALAGSPHLLPLPEYGEEVAEALFGGSTAEDRGRMTERSVLSMVREGLGVGLLSELFLRAEGVRGIPTEPPLCRELGIALPSGGRQADAVRRFVAEAKRLAEEE